MAVDARGPYVVGLLLILPRQDSDLSSSKEIPETGLWHQVGHGILGTEAVGYRHKKLSFLFGASKNQCRIHNSN